MLYMTKRELCNEIYSSLVNETLDDVSTEKDLYVSTDVSTDVSIPEPLFERLFIFQKFLNIIQNITVKHNNNTFITVFHEMDERLPKVKFVQIFIDNQYLMEDEDGNQYILVLDIDDSSDMIIELENDNGIKIFTLTNKN